MGLNLNTQTAASGEAAAGIEKAQESAGTANPLTPTIDGNDSPNNAGGPAATETAVVESEDLAGNDKLVEVDVSTPADNTIALFSSSPVNNYAVGDFQFENGLLRFSKGDEEELQKFLNIIESKNFPMQEKARIVKINVQAAERILADAKAGQGGTTQAIDSTVGERVNKPKAEGNLGTTGKRGN